MLLHEIEIAFMVSPERAKNERSSKPIAGKESRLVNYTINLDELSPMANQVARSIRTTSTGDDMGKVLNRSRVTRRQMAIDEWDTIRKSLDPTETLDQFLERAAKFPGGSLDDHDSFYWVWDELNLNETPEQFLERQVARMQKEGEIELVHKDIHEKPGHRKRHQRREQH
jgi:hypothetical protein